MMLAPGRMAAQLKKRKLNRRSVLENAGASKNQRIKEVRGITGLA